MTIESDLAQLRRRGGPCSVVDSIYCESRRTRRIHRVCYACGEFVCVNCSLEVRWGRRGNQVVCHNCLRQENPYDGRVYAHLYQLAGYPAAQGRESAVRDAIDSQRRGR